MPHVGNPRQKTRGDATKFNFPAMSVFHEIATKVRPNGRKRPHAQRAEVSGGMAEKLAHFTGETSNQLFEILREWNDVLRTTSLNPSQAGRPKKAVSG